MGFITALPRKNFTELQASAEGLLTQNFDRQAAANFQLLTGGVAYGMLVGLRGGQVITNVYVEVTTAGSATSLFKAGIYNISGTTQHAVSADQSTLFNSTGVKTVPLTATWTVPADAGYMVVLVSTAGTTLPTLKRGLSSSVANQIGSNALPFATGGSGLSDLPAVTVTFSATSNSPAPMWVGLG